MWAKIWGCYRLNKHKITEGSFTVFAGEVLEDFEANDIQSRTSAMPRNKYFLLSMQKVMLRLQPD